MNSPSIIAFPASNRAALFKVLFALGCLAILLWTVGSEAMFGLDLSEYQIIALPLVWILLWRLRVAGVLIPRVVLLISVIGAILSLGYSRLHVPDEQWAIVVSHFQADEFEIKTRQFRERLEHEIGRAAPHFGVRVERSSLSISSHREALRFLNSAEHLPAVIWGTSRWVNVSMHPERTASLNREALEPWISIVGLEIVPSVPIIGMSKEPESDTARFLVTALGGLFSGSLKAHEHSDSVRSWTESTLLGAATQQSPWTTFAHRAFPWFVIGNRHFAQALKGGTYQAGEMACAIEAYTNVRRSLRAGDNPELLAAALNNRAVAHAIVQLVERRPELKRLIRRELRTAAHAAREKNLFKVEFLAPKIAKLNLEMLERKSRTRLGRSAQKRRETGVSGRPKVAGQGEGKRRRANRVRPPSSTL